MTFKTKEYQSIRSRSSGAILTEAAIVFPLLLIVLVAILDFSTAFYSSYILGEAVRDSARELSVRRAFQQSDIELYQSRIVQVIDEYTPLSNITANVSTPDQVVVGFDNQKSLVITADGTYRYFFLGMLGIRDKRIQRQVVTRYERQAINNQFPPL